MITSKNISLKGILKFSGHHLIWIVSWMSIMTIAFYFTNWKWLTMPWVPISLVGTAVAFYVGFKNNQAYDRLWEARKIWGGIINSSRTWGSFVNAIFNKKDAEIAKKLIYRNIAYNYILRQQLLQPAQWEHINRNNAVGKFSKKQMNKYGEGAFTDEVKNVDIKKYLDGLSEKQLNEFGNKALFILDQQTKLLQQLTEENKIDWFKQLELQRILNDFFEHQGKLERIKKFPLPRQYGSFSIAFVAIFIFLLPFALLGEFEKFGKDWIWLAIPAGTIVSWIYVVMELIGDYSENPFEGLPNDIPMLSICRTIEIDLLKILEEENIPTPIQANNNVLM